MRAFVSFLLSFTLCAGANAATVKFTKTTYSVNVHPVLVQTGDFNGDGIPDVITANGIIGGKSTLSVWLGNGDGTLRQTRITQTQQIEHIALGDFNRDGKLDVASIGFDGNFATVLLGVGDGTFQPGIDYSVSSAPGAIATADFNGDGKLDLAVADNTINTVSVLLGNGDGSFQSPLDAPADVPFLLATGDFNHDGKIDIAAGSGGVDPVIDLLLGNGDGTFQSPIALSTGRVPPVLVDAADLNHDGNLDILFVKFDNTPTGVLLGNGDGTFQPEIDSGGPGQFGTASYAIADFDGDGNLDYAGTASLTRFVNLYTGFGNGHFHISQRLSPTSGIGSFTIATADLNCDSRPDLIVAEQGGTLIVYLNQGP